MEVVTKRVMKVIFDMRWMVVMDVFMVVKNVVMVEADIETDIMVAQSYGCYDDIMVDFYWKCGYEGEYGYADGYGDASHGGYAGGHVGYGDGTYVTCYAGGYGYEGGFGGGYGGGSGDGYQSSH